MKLERGWSTMMLNYSEYLECPKSIPIEKMHSIHSQMILEINNDHEGLELYDELIEKAVQYAAFRANWFVWDRETRIEQDASRSCCHNSLIVKFNMLAKYLKMQGKEAAWRDELGHEEDDKCNRKAIGDFACYLVFVNCLNAR